MTIDLTETTAGAIQEALMQARHRLGGPALGMVLTLVIVTDESAQYDAVRAASHAAREHPCRVIGVITRSPVARARLDAEIRVGETGPGETLLLRLYGPVGEHADSVVVPLLLPDTPVVIWWPGAAPPIPSADPLGALAQRRVTDAAASDKPRQVLTALAAGYQPGDTDLSWTRATSWRSVLAATLDQPHGAITGGVVQAERHNPTGDLVATWLASRLDVPVHREMSDGPGITEVAFSTDEGDITLCRADGRNATLTKPGQADRKVALHRRETAELLAEELRRLDPDEVYAETLARFAEYPVGEAYPPADGERGDSQAAAGSSSARQEGAGQDSGGQDSGG